MVPNARIGGDDRLPSRSIDGAQSGKRSRDVRKRHRLRHPKDVTHLFGCVVNFYTFYSKTQ
jgi:hypothetical protein